MLTINNVKYIDANTTTVLYGMVGANFDERMGTSFEALAETVAREFRLDNTDHGLVYVIETHILSTVAMNEKVSKFFSSEILDRPPVLFDKLCDELSSAFGDFAELIEKKDTPFPEEYRNTAKKFSLNEFASIIYRMSRMADHVPWIKNYFENFMMDQNINFNSIDIYRSGLDTFQVDPFRVFRFIGMLNGFVEYKRDDMKPQQKEAFFKMVYTPPIENPFNLMLKRELSESGNGKKNHLTTAQIKALLTDINENGDAFADLIIKNDNEFLQRDLMPFIKLPDISNITTPILDEESIEKMKKKMREVLFFTEISSRQVCKVSDIVAKIEHGDVYSKQLPKS